MEFYDYMLSVLVSLLEFEIPFGNRTVTVTSLTLYVLVLAAFYLISKTVRRFVRLRLFPRMQLAPSTEFVVLKVIHYGVMILGIFVVLGSLGIDLTTLTMIAGLLSVGIGFGLQNLAANFISGIILLIEQPIKVGDWVELDGLEGEVKEINLRATGIETNDAVYIIVPNQDLLTGRVINGSLGSPYIRTRTAVGVSYSADMKLVREVLLRVAEGNAKVLKDPAPEVWLVGFGESSVDFEILCYIKDPKCRLRMCSDLYLDAWWALKEAGIEIPFPQRDLHIRSSAVPLTLASVETVPGQPRGTASA